MLLNKLNKKDLLQKDPMQSEKNADKEDNLNKNLIIINFFFFFIKENDGNKNNDLHTTDYNSYMTKIKPLQLSPYDVLARCKNSKGSTVQCVVHRCTRFTRSRTVFCNSDRSFALSLLLLLLQVLSCSP